MPDDDSATLAQAIRLLNSWSVTAAAMEAILRAADATPGSPERDALSRVAHMLGVARYGSDYASSAVVAKMQADRSMLEAARQLVGSAAITRALDVLHSYTAVLRQIPASGEVGALREYLMAIETVCGGLAATQALTAALDWAAEPAPGMQPARLDPDGSATGKTAITAPVVGHNGPEPFPGPAGSHIDMETGKRTSLDGSVCAKCNGILPHVARQFQLKAGTYHGCECPPVPQRDAIYCQHGGASPPPTGCRCAVDCLCHQRYGVCR